jgi:hypothetical protein
MRRSVRILAALLLAILLPVQGWAAACAQICARMNEERHAAMMMADHAGQHEDAMQDGIAPHENCGKSELGAGKCCQAHVFIVLMTPSFDPFPLASEHPAATIARWTSFIPEEPSPPPIVSSSVA